MTHRLLTMLVLGVTAAAFMAVGCGSSQYTEYPTEIGAGIEGCQEGELVEINIGIGDGDAAQGASKYEVGILAHGAGVGLGVICIEGTVTDSSVTASVAELRDGFGNVIALDKPGEFLNVTYNSSLDAIVVQGAVRCAARTEDALFIRLSNVALNSDVVGEDLEPLGDTSGAVVAGWMLMTRSDIVGGDDPDAGLAMTVPSDFTLEQNPAITDTALKPRKSLAEWTAERPELVAALATAGEEHILAGDRYNTADVAHCFETDGITGECIDSGFVHVLGEVASYQIAQAEAATGMELDMTQNMVFDIDATALKTGDLTGNATILFQQNIIYDFIAEDYQGIWVGDADSDGAYDITEEFVNSFYEMLTGGGPLTNG